MSEKARLLLELSRDISATLDLQEVLDKSLEALRKLLDFDGGSIQFIVDDALQLVAADPPAPPEVYAFRLPLGEGFGGRVAETGEPIYSPDATVDERAHPEGRRKASTAGVRSYFAAPLIESGRPIGLVQLDSRTVDAFPPHVQELVLSFVPTIAAAVQNARLFAREIETVNQQLEAERLKTDFLAVVSHELRTPLTSVIGLAETIDIHAADFDEAMIHDCARRISHAGRVLERLIDDLLKLSTATTGRVVTEAVAGDIAGIVQWWASGIEQETHPVAVRVESDLPEVVFDSGHLLQILENLMSNAVKFSSPGTPIEVAVRRRDDRVAVSVTDHGKGIAPEFHERIFDRFFQVEPPATRSTRGLGIGLTLARHLCRLMSAEIGLESEPGAGSTFTILLSGAPSD